MRVDDNARRAGQADDRIAAKTLAALHRFEQIGVGAIGQLEVDRERGIEIGKGLEGNGNAVVAFSGQPVENGFNHDKLHKQ